VNPNRVTDHLANERTFLAWLRTGLAVAVFGFAIGRFAIAIRQLTEAAGRPVPTSGVSVWFGTAAIVAGVALMLMGLFRYRQTRRQLDAGQFAAAGFLIDFAGVLAALFGVALAAYLIYVGFRL
jgi:inner membrane protein YidH